MTFTIQTLARLLLPIVFEDMQKDQVEITISMKCTNGFEIVLINPQPDNDSVQLLSKYQSKILNKLKTVSNYNITLDINILEHGECSNLFPSLALVLYHIESLPVDSVILTEDYQLIKLPTGYETVEYTN